MKDAEAPAAAADLNVCDPRPDDGLGVAAFDRYGAPMTYPPPQYFDDSGLINVTNRDAHTKPELAMETGVEIFFLLSAAESEGEVGLFRWDASDERV